MGEEISSKYQSTPQFLDDFADWERKIVSVELQDPDAALVQLSFMIDPPVQVFTHQHLRERLADLHEEVSKVSTLVRTFKAKVK